MEVSERSNKINTGILNHFSAGHKKRIMVVEDDKTHRSLMKKILEEFQCDLTLAENGLIALSKLESGMVFDLIIMDWDMPELNGLDAVRILRMRHAERKIPYVPVIAFTAKREPGDREQCLAAGMDGYLHKDIWMSHWRQSLVDILQGLISGNFDIHDLEEDGERKFNTDDFDESVFRQTVDLLKDDFLIAIGEYFDDAAIYVAGIKEGLFEEDFRKIGKNSHPLKSNSKSFGLNSIASIADEINKQTRDKMKSKERIAALNILVPQLEKSFQSGHIKIKSILSENC